MCQSLPQWEEKNTQSHNSFSSLRIPALGTSKNYNYSTHSRSLFKSFQFPFKKVLCGQILAQSQPKKVRALH